VDYELDYMKDQFLSTNALEECSEVLRSAGEEFEKWKKEHDHITKNKEGSDVLNNNLS
jgi:hypothetical protein